MDIFYTINLHTSLDMYITSYLHSIWFTHYVNILVVNCKPFNSFTNYLYGTFTNYLQLIYTLAGKCALPTIYIVFDLHTM
jgi:hypothetical protein